MMYAMCEQNGTDLKNVDIGGLGNLTPAASPSPATAIGALSPGRGASVSRGSATSSTHSSLPSGEFMVLK